jgi:hypothetical protein
MEMLTWLSTGSQLASCLQHPYSKIGANSFSGSISQWGEVKKKQPKSKDTPASATETSTSTRGGRGRGNFENRGRVRGAERSRGGRSGRGASQTNGTKSSENATKTTGDGWGDTTGTGTGTETAGFDNTGNAGNNSWDSAPETANTSTADWVNDSVNDHAAPPTTENPKSEPPPPTTKPSTWSKLFAPPPPAPKKASVPVPVAEPEETSAAPAMEQNIPTENLPPPIETQIVEDKPSEDPEESLSDPPTDLTPSKEEPTETNLELLPEVSPPATATAASTVASMQDPLSSLPATTPTVRPMSGYAASALKATSGTGRSASITRKVMEQQEAVVMPGNHAVDRAAVQFGSMGLTGSSDDVDVDEDREEPETRTQLPDDSPAAPRASLPPSNHEIEATAPAAPEAPQAQRQAPGLPPIQNQVVASSSPPASTYNDQYRYGQTGPKGYDPFGQQQTQPPQTQSSQSQSLEPFANQVPAPSQPQVAPGQSDYSSYYGANARDPYQNYYGYGQGQETQQRSGSASFGTSAQDVQSQYATSRPQQAYGQQDAQNSGHNTPNPTMPAHQAQHSQHIPQNHGGYGGYPQGYANNYGQQYPQYGGGYGVNNRYGANRPLFDDVRRQGGQENDYYINQNQYAYGQGQQYSGTYNKSSMYGQPHQQYSYEHSSSPANTGAYGQSAQGVREAAYGRTGSAQPSETQQAAGNATFSGGISDPFGRSHSGFGQQQTSAEDPAKAYEAAKASGPSPAISQSNRPGSAVNNMPGQQTGQSGGFPPPHSQHSAQQTFGGYPQYTAGYGGGHQGQNNHPQNTGYGGYGSNAAGFNTTYGQGYGSGRGWNANYGASH